MSHIMSDNFYEWQKDNLSWNEALCQFCGQILIGEDLGDIEYFLTYDCIDCCNSFSRYVDLPCIEEGDN